MDKNPRMQKHTSGLSNGGDTVDKLVEDMPVVSQWKDDPALSRKVASDCDKTLEWLHSDCGVNFKAGMKVLWPQLSRSHLVIGSFKPGATSSINTAKKLGVDLCLNVKGIGLLSDKKTGAVNGVRAKDKDGIFEIHSRRLPKRPERPAS